MYAAQQALKAKLGGKQRNNNAEERLMYRRDQSQSNTRGTFFLFICRCHGLVLPDHFSSFVRCCPSPLQASSRAFPCVRCVRSQSASLPSFKRRMFGRGRNRGRFPSHSKGKGKRITNDGTIHDWQTSGLGRAKIFSQERNAGKTN